MKDHPWRDTATDIINPRIVGHGNLALAVFMAAVGALNVWYGDATTGLVLVGWAVYSLVSHVVSYYKYRTGYFLGALDALDGELRLDPHPDDARSARP